MSKQLLDITVKCKGNEQCLFNGEDLFIEIIITNKQKSPVGFPLEFIKTIGPIIRLIDTYTKKETNVPTSLGESELLEKFTMIQPGKSLSMEWVIDSYYLEQISGHHVDVSAETTVVAKILVDGKLVDFEGSDTIHIVSKDKP